MKTNDVFAAQIAGNLLKTAMMLLMKMNQYLNMAVIIYSDFICHSISLLLCYQIDHTLNNIDRKVLVIRKFFYQISMFMDIGQAILEQMLLSFFICFASVHIIHSENSMYLFLELQLEIFRNRF